MCACFLLAAWCLALGSRLALLTQANLLLKHGHLVCGCQAERRLRRRRVRRKKGERVG